MAKVVVTLKIMPASPQADLKAIEKKATKLIADFGGEVGKVDIQPVAFGLNSVNLYFVMDEAKGSTEKLENQVAKLPQVNSAEVIDVRRAVG